MLLMKKNKGVALITALLVVALATIMAVALTSRQYIDIRRTGNMMKSDQAFLDAIAAETFVAHTLASFRSEGGSKYDDLTLFNLALTQLSGDMSDDNRLVSVQALYPESRFNVNTLVKIDDKPNEKQIKVFRRLLRSVLTDLNVNPGEVDSLISNLIDWIDANEEARIDGAEDGVYEGKDPPYKAANRMLTSISELRLVEGFSEELLDGVPADEEQEIEAIDGLLAYVDALPDRVSTINVNSVIKPQVFQSLGTYMEDTMVEDLMNAQPFEELTNFTGHETFDSIKSSEKDGGANWKDLKKEIKEYTGSLDVQSSYFLIKTNVAVGKTVVDLNTLVYVSTDGTKLEVISRAIGTDGI